MEYAEFVRQIKFRLLQPDARRPAAIRALSRLAQRSRIHLDMWMTVLPEGQESIQRRLRPLCRIRRRSTFAVGALINRGVAELPSQQAFVCLGVEEGFPLLAGMAGNRGKCCIGVDLFRRRSTRYVCLDAFEQWKSPRHEFHEQDFRDYFAHTHQGPIGLLACMGSRTYRDQVDALRLAEPFMAPAGMVLIDRINAPEIRRAADDFRKESARAQRVVLDVQTPHPRHPTFGDGVLVLQSGLPKTTLAPAPEADRRAA
jgi:hypothetical protein